MHPDTTEPNSPSTSPAIATLRTASRSPATASPHTVRTPATASRSRTSPPAPPSATPRTGNAATWRSRRRSGTRSSPEFESADPGLPAGPQISPGGLRELLPATPQPEGLLPGTSQPRNPGLDLGVQAHPGTGSQPPPTTARSCSRGLVRSSIDAPLAHELPSGEPTEGASLRADVDDDRERLTLTTRHADEPDLEA